MPVHAPRARASQVRARTERCGGRAAHSDWRRESGLRSATEGVLAGELPGLDADSQRKLLARAPLRPCAPAMGRTGGCAPNFFRGERHRPAAQMFTQVIRSLRERTARLRADAAISAIIQVCADGELLKCSWDRG